MTIKALPEVGVDLRASGQAFDAKVDEIAALNREIGRLETILEIQDWAKQNRDALKRAGLYARLLRLCGQ